MPKFTKLDKKDKIGQYQRIRQHDEQIEEKHELRDPDLKGKGF